MSEDGVVYRAEPLMRNVDVFSLEEAQRRFREMCMGGNCMTCRFRGCMGLEECALAWAYEAAAGARLGFWRRVVAPSAERSEG